MTLSDSGIVAPGNSIGGTLNVGNLSFNAATATLDAEIDLSVPTAADLLNVTGSVSLGGASLALSLLNAPMSLASPLTFLMVSNDMSDPISGTFGSILGLPAIYNASVDYAYRGTDAVGRTGDGNDLAITLSTILPGDYNRNGFVDAADYVSWRKVDDTQPGYDAWRANFGTSRLAGMGTDSVANVPEPATAGITILAAIALLGLYKK